MSFIGAWRIRRTRYRLEGTICPHCGSSFARQHLVCPHCKQEVDGIVQRVFPSLPSRPGAELIAASVIIPAYNAAYTIRDTLRCLHDQTCTESYEVILVDSSNDGTDTIVSGEFPWVHLVHLSEQTDPGTARNIAISQARGEIIACLDADCLTPRTWLESMLAAQRQGHQVVGGSVENGNPQSLVAWAGYLGEFREFLPVGGPRVVTHVPTCNISYHRSIFERFGGFPTKFYPQEDLLFHWRLAQQGVPIWFAPAIEVRHVPRAGLASYLRHQHRIGAITARVLALTGAEGAFLARTPALALLAAPGLPLVKFLRTIAHLITCQPDLLRRHWPALPVLLLGLYTWVVGFAAGAGAEPLNVPLQESLSLPVRNDRLLSG